METASPELYVLAPLLLTDREPARLARLQPTWLPTASPRDAPAGHTNATRSDVPLPKARAHTPREPYHSM